MRASAILCLSAAVSTVACSVPDVRFHREAIVSDAARIVDFDFAAEVIAPKGASPRATIVSQLMYVQGVLVNAGNGNAQIGHVELANVRAEDAGDKTRIMYDATLPVAWPKDVDVPTSYELALPRDASSFDAFDAKYGGRCGDNGHGPDAFWFDWNPKASGCSIDADDVTKVRVSVARSVRETTDRYPEYDLVWADDRLDVVAVFGIVEADTPRDWGYVEAQRFLEHARAKLADVSTRSHDATASIRKDTTMTGRATVGGRVRDVRLDVLVVADFVDAGDDFDARYDPLTERADLVFYNGHAVHGKAVEVFARKGKVAAGKYQIVLVDGCQTFAYLDTTMADRRRAANGDEDPHGTKYLDVVANALPNPVDEFAHVSSVLFDAIVEADAPKPYEQVLTAMPSAQVVVVFGEEDNRFTPR